MSIFQRHIGQYFKLLNNTDGKADARIGGRATATVALPRFQLERVAKIPLASAADTGGAVFGWQNDEGQSIIITRILLDVTTKSTDAATLDVGTTATNATTSSDNLLDGLDVGTAAGLFSNLKNPGSNGVPDQKLASGKWVTASRASGAVAGMVGSAYIYYILA